MRRGAILRSALSALALIASAAPASAQVTRPLSAEEVACTAGQLHELIRFSFNHQAGPAGVFDHKQVAMALTYGPARRFQGVAFTEQYQDYLGDLAPTPEHQIAFTIVPTIPVGRSVRITRDEVASTLVDRGDIDGLVVSLWTSRLAPSAPFDPAPVLELNNFTAPDAKTADTATNGGLFLGRCHTKLTATDLRVFAILARVVRAVVFLDHPDFQHDPTSVAIYRGRRAHPIPGGMRTTYRLDVYSTGGFDRLAAEVVIDIRDDGTLGDARLGVLDACTQPGQLACTTTGRKWRLHIIKPLAAGAFWNPDEAVAACTSSLGCFKNRFSFASLLEGTALEGI